jgi:hypothetical protein
MNLQALQVIEVNKPITGVTTTPNCAVAFKTILRYFKVFPFCAVLYIKHFFNIPSECTLIFYTYFITCLLPVSVCYVYHLQGESLIRSRCLCVSNTRFSLTMVFKNVGELRQKLCIKFKCALG